jgi:hypothetical protein
MGATYIKNHHGPTSVELDSIIDDMVENGDIEAVQSKYFKYEQKKIFRLSALILMFFLLAKSNTLKRYGRAFLTRMLKR